MNAKDLKRLLKNVPDEMDIFISERLTEFEYGLANSGYIREISFMQEPNGEELCKTKVFVLSEEWKHIEFGIDQYGHDSIDFVNILALGH